MLLVFLRKKIDLCLTASLSLRIAGCSFWTVNGIFNRYFLAAGWFLGNWKRLPRATTYRWMSGKRSLSARSLPEVQCESKETKWKARVYFTTMRRLEFTMAEKLSARTECPFVDSSLMIISIYCPAWCVEGRGQRGQGREGTHSLVPMLAVPLHMYCCTWKGIYYS